MSIDLVLGKSRRSWGRGASPESLGGDPLVWTPSAVRAELDRVRDLLDVVNVEMSMALADKKITGAEWGRWAATYKTAHRFTRRASSLWGSNAIAARQHEGTALAWRSLLKERGARLAGPGGLGRRNGGVSTLAALTPVLAGGLAAGIIVHKFHRWYRGNKT